MSSLQTTIDHLKDQNDLLRADVDTAIANTDSILADATQAQANTADWVGEGEQAIEDATQARQEAETSQAVAEAALASTEAVAAQAEVGVTLARGVAAATEAVVVADAGFALDPLAEKVKAIASVYQQPSLELDFVNQRYTVQGDAPWLREDLDPAEDLTFTRASTKWVWDAEGVLTEVPVDQPAYDHDPVTGEPLGVLIEPSRTNIVPSSVMDDWTLREGVTLTSGHPSPDGNNDAVLITPGTEVTTGASLFYESYLESDGGWFRSLYVKSNGIRYCALSRLSSWNSNPNICLVFDLETMSVSTSGYLHVNGFIEELGSGWFRIGFYADGGASGYGHFRIGAATGLNRNLVEGFTGDGTSGLYVWGAQMEEGPFPTSYIPTNGAPVTRAADNMSRTLGAEWNPSAGTFFLDYDESGNENVFGAYGQNNRNSGVRVFRSESTGRVTLAVESIGIYDVLTAQPSNRSRPLEPRRVAFSLDAGSGSVILAVDGVSTVGTSQHTSAALAYITQFWLNRGRPLTSTSNGANPIRNVRYYPRSMTEAELIELTTLPEEPES